MTLVEAKDILINMLQEVDGDGEKDKIDALLIAIKSVEVLTVLNQEIERYLR